MFLKDFRSALDQSIVMLYGRAMQLSVFCSCVRYATVSCKLKHLQRGNHR